MNTTPDSATPAPADARTTDATSLPRDDFAQRPFSDTSRSDLLRSQAREHAEVQQTAAAAGPQPRPFTLIDLVQAHMGGTKHIAALVETNLRDLEDNCSFLVDALLAAPEQTPPQTLASVEAKPSSPSDLQTPSKAPTPASTSMSFPELDVLLETQRKFSVAIVEKIQKLDQFSRSLSDALMMAYNRRPPSFVASNGQPPPFIPGSPQIGGHVPVPSNLPVSATGYPPFPRGTPNPRAQFTSPAGTGVPPPAPSTAPQPLSGPGVAHYTHTPINSYPQRNDLAPTAQPLPPGAASAQASHAAPPGQLHAGPIDTGLQRRAPILNTHSQPPLPPSTTAVPVSQVQRYQIPPSQVPPPHLLPVNKPRTIPDLFPLIDPPLLSAVVRHEFNPADLWKLDIRDSVVDRNTNLTLHPPPLPANTPMPAEVLRYLQRFPTLNSLLIPLTTYFRVLVTALTFKLSHPAFYNPMVSMSGPAPQPVTETLRAANNAIQLYFAHLIDLEERYDWIALIPYHLAFHERRRVEMASGRDGVGNAEGFGGWGRADGELIATYLFGREKGRVAGQCVIPGTRMTPGPKANTIITTSESPVTVAGPSLNTPDGATGTGNKIKGKKKGRR